MQVEELWRVPTFERRMAAALVLELHADELRSEDLSLIERLIREFGRGRWWTSFPGMWSGRWDCTFASDAPWIGGLATTTSGSDGHRCSQN